MYFIFVIFSWDRSYKNILFVRLANVYLRLDLGMKRLNLKYCCKVIFLVILDTSFPKCWTISSTLIFSTFTTCKWWSWNVVWTTVFLFSKSLLITGSSRFLECMFISCRRFHTLCVFIPFDSNGLFFLLLVFHPALWLFIRTIILNALMSVSSLSLRSLSFTILECTPHTILSLNISSSNVLSLKSFDSILKSVTYWSMVYVFPWTLVRNIFLPTVIFSLGAQYFF